MNLVHNEKIKLTATWLNGIAVAAVGVGGIAPSIAIVTGAIGSFTGVGLVVIWALVGMGLHLWARSILSNLKDDGP